MLWSLAPIPNMSHGHIQRSHYVVLICSSMTSAPDSNLSPLEFGWNSVNSVLIPNKYIVTLPEMHTVTCGYKRKTALEDVSAASVVLQAQNFKSATEKNVVPKFPLRLSWTLHKISKYKGFLCAKISRTKFKNI